MQCEKRTHFMHCFHVAIYRCSLFTRSILTFHFLRCETFIHSDFFLLFICQILCFRNNVVSIESRENPFHFMLVFSSFQSTEHLHSLIHSSMSRSSIDFFVVFLFMRLLQFHNLLLVLFGFFFRPETIRDGACGNVNTF